MSLFLYKIENFEQIPSSFMDVMLPRLEHEVELLVEEAHNGINYNEADNKDDKEGVKLKSLLLNSKSFIGHAKKLLNLDMDCPMVLPKYKPKEIANSRVYVDIANEVIKRKSFQESQIVQPLLPTCVGNSRLHISLVQLVEQVNNAIENVKSCSKISGGKVFVGSLKCHDKERYKVQWRHKCNMGLGMKAWVFCR